MLKEKHLVPKLRFSEFEEIWEKKRFSKYIKLYRGSSPRPINQYLTNEENGVNWIKIGDTKNVINNLLSNVSEKITEKGATKSRKVKKGELILANSMSFGKTYLLDIDGCIYDGWFVLREYEDFFNKTFLIQQLNSEFLQKQYKRLSAGGVVQNISSEIVYSTYLCKPSIPEQQKIANFLTAIDNQIQTLEKKKSLLEQYKKGVMQKIFKQELRFKDDDGNAFPGWELVKLKEVLKRSKLKNTDVKIKYVLTNSATQGIVSQNDYFDKDIANQNNLQGYYIVEKDDFIYNPRISQFAPVGPLKRNKLAQGVMSPLYTVLRPKKGNLEFLEFYFETTLWHKYMKAIANYGARHDRMNITMTDFENLPIPFPLLQEQIKIANFLSAIDKNIALLNTKIEQTKAYKKGLLQQMFV